MENWGKIGDEISDWILNYAEKNNISTLVVGVSGGIDSAVTSTLCAKTGLKTLVVNMPIHQAKSQFNLSDLHIKWLEEKWNNVEGHLINLSPNPNERFSCKDSIKYIDDIISKEDSLRDLSKTIKSINIDDQTLTDSIESGMKNLKKVAEKGIYKFT